jgi:hypothetical protein
MFDFVSSSKSPRWNLGFQVQARFANTSRARKCAETYLRTHSRLDKGDKLEGSRLTQALCAPKMTFVIRSHAKSAKIPLSDKNDRSMIIE